MTVDDEYSIQYRSAIYLTELLTLSGLIKSNSVLLKFDDKYIKALY